MGVDMSASIYRNSDTPPVYPCWLFLPECQEWQWVDFDPGASWEYMTSVWTHWSPGGRRAAPEKVPNGACQQCGEIRTDGFAEMPVCPICWDKAMRKS